MPLPRRLAALAFCLTSTLSLGSCTSVGGIPGTTGTELVTFGFVLLSNAMSDSENGEAPEEIDYDQARVEAMQRRQQHWEAIKDELTANGYVRGDADSLEGNWLSEDWQAHPAVDQVMYSFTSTGENSGTGRTRAWADGYGTPRIDRHYFEFQWQLAADGQVAMTIEKVLICANRRQEWVAREGGFSIGLFFQAKEDGEELQFVSPGEGRAIMTKAPADQIEAPDHGAPCTGSR